MQNPLLNYKQSVENGKIGNDAAQELVILRLQELWQQLEASPPKTNLLQKLLNKKAPPRSIYIWGEVGRGKSMLMDMFFASLTNSSKQRIHFHSLMLKIHSEIHKLRQNNDDEPLINVAKQIAQDTKILCLDEFQVTDVADAMILSKLFLVLLEAGVTFVITSNRPPEDLYLGGLQREKFLDFVKLIYEKMEVLELSSPHDYRMQQIQALQSVYLFPLSPKNEQTLKQNFADFIHNSFPSPITLEVQGRKLIISETYGGVAKFSFKELCEKPLGTADYIAISRRFHTIFISSIPKLTPQNRNEARRFVTLIDNLYDHRVKLICTADSSPQEIYADGDGKFEFHRTVSRLTEMQSAQYLETPHLVG